MHNYPAQLHKCVTLAHLDTKGVFPHLRLPDNVFSCSNAYQQALWSMCRAVGAQARTPGAGDG